MFHLFIYYFFYSDEEFGPNLSSHSWRKRGSNNTRKAGATRDEKDHRGRWKGKKRVSDCYDDVELPWPDVKMAGLLCPGGPCKYVMDKDSGVTPQFILEHVLPHANRRIPNTVALTLGTALLWYIFSDRNENDRVPVDIEQRVRSAFDQIRPPLFTSNPVR